MSDNVFSYTNRDYESTRQESISKIPNMSKGAWTDLNATDPGIIILDLVHALVDMMQYNMDHNAMESFISTAKERKNLFRLANQLGYTINHAKGAEVIATFSVKNGYSSTFIIPKNTVLLAETTNNIKIPYLTTEDLYMYAGIKSATVLCRQGTIVEESYYGTGRSSIENSDNGEDQYTILDNLGIDIDSISIEDDKGYSWTRVDNVYLSDPNTRNYSATLTYDGKVRIQFGNDDRGYTPRSMDLLTIRYTYSLGSEGSIAANTLNTIKINNFITDSGQKVTDLTVTNLENSTTGEDPEDSETIRELAPYIIKSQDRAVTLSDFEYLAKKVSGVKDAKAYDINNAPDSCLYYEVKVLILPENKSNIDILKTNVYNYLYERCTPPTVLSIITPSSTDIDITATVVINNNYTDEVINYKIRETLVNYFNNLSNTLGGTINPNTLISLISKIDGVLYVDNFTPSDIIELEDLEIPTLGNINLTLVRRNA